MQICNTTRNGGDNALSAGESKAVLAEANKMSKAFKKNFEAVLQVRAIMKSLLKSGTAPRTPPPKNFRAVRYLYLLTWDPRNPFKHEILTDCLNFFFREISLNPSVQCWTTWSTLTVTWPDPWESTTIARKHSNSATAQRPTTTKLQVLFNHSKSSPGH